MNVLTDQLVCTECKCKQEYCINVSLKFINRFIIKEFKFKTQKIPVLKKFKMTINYEEMI